MTTNDDEKTNHPDFDTRDREGYDVAPTVHLRDGRELTALGGLGVKRELRTMRNSAGVWWSTGANSYVAVQTTNGFRVLSINGIGEIRWELDPLNLGWTGDGDARAAVAYFFEVK